MKLDDDLVELQPLDAMRVGPGVTRSFKAGLERTLSFAGPLRIRVPSGTTLAARPTAWRGSGEGAFESRPAGGLAVRRQHELDGLVEQRPQPGRDLLDRDAFRQPARGDLEPVAEVEVELASRPGYASIPNTESPIA